MNIILWIFSIKILSYVVIEIIKCQKMPFFNYKNNLINFQNEITFEI